MIILIIFKPNSSLFLAKMHVFLYEIAIKILKVNFYLAL